MDITLFMSEPWEEKTVEEKLSGQSVTCLSHTLDATVMQTAKDAEVITSFVDFPLGEKELAAMPKLKMIATRSTGFDHIDLSACAKRGIIVSNVPFYGENTVAEYAMALLLSLTRKIHLSFERTRRGDFSNEGLRGLDLKGRTMGIIGCGHIGQHTARMAKAFDMNVIGFDVKPNPEVANQCGFRYVDFDELLKQSDVISVHVPFIPQTYHLINMDNVEKIKKGCVLINTARGPVVDTTAIVHGLKKGIFAGVGLDVMEEERAMHHEKEELLASGYFDHDEVDREKVKTIIENHVLLTYDNVIIAGHNAANTQGAMERISQTTIENILAFIKGAPQNVVKPV